MNDFTASNGVTVRPDDAGLVCHRADGAEVYVGPESSAALREWFLAERDKELERWRSPSDSRYFVRVFGGPNQIEVIFEPKMIRRRYFSRSAVGTESEKNWSGIPGPELDAIALEYYAAHPEVPPWARAADGDIWELTSSSLNHGQPAQYLHDGGRFFKLPLLEPRMLGWMAASYPSEFDSGRLVWPVRKP